MKNLTQWVLESSKPKARKVEFVDYRSDEVGKLMQHENIEVNEGSLIRSNEVQPINNMNQVFFAGPTTETLVYYSQDDKQMMMLANEFAEIAFIYEDEVSGIHKIKPIVNDAMSSKKWTAHEIV